jgi:tryptophan synthase alpha chain
MSRLQSVFTKKDKSQKKVFVAYITAGDPNLDRTYDFCKILANAGVDVIELGIPYSDPLADGQTNQLAAQRALKQGTSLAASFDLVERLRADGFETPIVIFSYLNPLLRMGWQCCVDRAKTSGCDGFLVLDLPPEEASSYLEPLRKTDIDSIFLASPTTTKDRLSLINNASSGFIYYVSRTGVTGAQTNISGTLESEIETVKSNISKPIVVGFGISTPEQAKHISGLADGIVIGSAIVDLIKEIGIDKQKDYILEEFVKSIRNALDQ